MPRRSASPSTQDERLQHAWAWRSLALFAKSSGFGDGVTDAPSMNPQSVDPRLTDTEPTAAGKPPVMCPGCGREDLLVEHSYRAAWQPVRVLRSDGQADDYLSFEYGDDVVVVGYSCACGWFDAADLSMSERARLKRHTDHVLERLARASREDGAPAPPTTKHRSAEAEHLPDV